MYRLSRLNASSHALCDEGIPVFARWFGSWHISVRRRVMSPPEISHGYDQAAQGWNRTLDRFGIPDAYETMLCRVLSEASPVINGSRPRVLDCGVGTGALPSALARVLVLSGFSPRC